MSNPLYRLVLQRFFCLTSFFLFFDCQVVLAQFEFDEPPISYTDSAANDAVAKLIKRLKAEDDDFSWDAKRGWLPSVLKSLEVSSETQTLVFSKTSLQIRAINPKNPRAIYFNDEVYVGYVPGGDIIELSAVDPQLGAVFYTLEQTETARPKILRDESQCMTCHGTSKTQNVPGYLTRSVYVGRSGHPHYSLGTITTDHQTDFKDRFGGWYVTGTHGELRHRGNVTAKNDPSNPIDREAGANKTELPKTIDTSLYMQATSDMVALMVLEHQSQMHNMITQASYETRQALFYQKTLNKALDRDENFQSESTQRRIASAGNKLLDYLLFRGEFKLTSPVQGNSEFAQVFVSQAIQDKQGRSLRELDLQGRLLRWPCSFLIYSQAFDELPDQVRKYVFNELVKGLDEDVPSKGFEHLSDEQRQTILEILIDTKPEVAEVALSLKSK